MPNDQNDLQVTDANAWRSSRKEGFVVRLPSGNTCRVRRTMDLMTMLRAGKIPNPLAKIVRESIRSSGDPTKMDTSDLDEEALEQMMDMIDKGAAKAIIEPPVMFPPDDEDDPENWVPPEGNISIYDLTIEDRMFVFNVAQGAAGDLNSFRRLQDRTLAHVPNGEQVSDSPQSATRD